MKKLILLFFMCLFIAHANIPKAMWSFTLPLKAKR